MEFQVFGFFCLAQLQLLGPGRERAEGSSTCWIIPQMPTMARPQSSQDPETPAGTPPGVEGLHSNRRLLCLKTGSDRKPRAPGWGVRSRQTLSCCADPSPDSSEHFSPRV